MPISNLQKITIVAERLLKGRLVELLRAEGATGHTLLAVEGEGSRGVNAGDFEGRNVQIETIVPASTAERILDRIEEVFFPDYAVIAYVSNVGVLRPRKFGGNGSAPPSPPADPS